MRNPNAPFPHTVRVQLPFHLQTLARAGPEVSVSVAAIPTTHSIVTALERQYPGLQGAILDPHSGKRRPLLRFFACRQDWSFEAADTPLPDDVVRGLEPFLIVGAISGG